MSDLWFFLFLGTTERRNEAVRKETVELTSEVLVVLDYGLRRSRSRSRSRLFIGITGSHPVLARLLTLYGDREEYGM